MRSSTFHSREIDAKKQKLNFASHRMTNDSLNRIYADGREEVVGYCQEFYLADNKEAEKAYYEHNRKFYQEVEEKGLA